MPIQSANQPYIITLDQWMGMNLQASRTSVNNQESYWLENMFPVGPGQLRSAYGPSAPLYTAPSGATILRIFFANITTQNPSGFMFLSNGNVDRVDLNSHAVTNLGQIWQPVAPQYWADLKLWMPSQFGQTTGEEGGVVIGSPAGLYAVDANDVVTAPGAQAPTWLTNGDATTMPTGLPGIYALEVYQQRLWVMGQTVISFSGPSNGANFSTAGGGGSFGFFGDRLTATYTDLQAAAGFLYVFGDSSTWSISGVQLAGQSTPIGEIYTSQFQFQNVDPQIGQRFPRPVGMWEQYFTVWNAAGLYGLINNQMNWISERLTNLLATLDVTPFMPTQCPAHIFGKKWMLFNGSLLDADNNRRSLMIAWSGPQFNQFVVCSQNLNLTEINQHEMDSVITPYGTDGTSLYKLFAQPDTTLTKRIETKAYTGTNFLTEKDWKRTYFEWQDNKAGPEGSFFTGTLLTQGPNYKGGSLPVSFAVQPGMWNTDASPAPGKGFWAALNLKSTSPDFTVARISFTFDERDLWGA